MTESVFDTPKALKLSPLFTLVAALAGAMMCRAVWMVFFYAPVEREMGFVQKIFYFHVPAAWTMFISVAVMAVASVGYLVRKTDGWDRVSDASVELAILFGAMVVISGPLWARKAWGVYWVWDVRLTSTLVLVLTLVAAKIARAYAGAAAKQIAAGLAIFAVLDMAFVYFSVQFWTSNHPPTTTKWNLEHRMGMTLLFSALTFLAAYAALLWARLRLGRLQTALDRLHMRATEAGIFDER